MGSTKKNKIIYAIQNNPLLIPVLIKDTSINRGFLYKELRKALPCRIGIEFELSGSFRGGYIKKYLTCFSDIPYTNNNIDSIMARYYGVLEIKSDDTLNPSPEAIYEVRVSIKDFHQLDGLYRFMQDLPEFCKLHQNGGIHIHVDLSAYNLSSLSEVYSNQSKTIEVSRYITHRLNTIEKIFPKYTGRYNKKKVGICTKATYVNLSRLGTMEVRIAPLTFSYSTLMSWVIPLIKFRQNLIHECRLSTKHIEDLPKDSACVEYITDARINGDTLCSNRYDDFTTVSTRYYSGNGELYVMNNGATSSWN